MPPQVPTPQATPLANLAVDFIRTLDLERGLSDNTCKAYEADCRRFLASLPPPLQQDATQICEKHFFDFLVTERERGQNVLSVRRSLSALRTFFGFLVGRGYLSEDPTRYLEAPKVGSRLPKVLRVQEVSQLMDAITEFPSRYPRRDKALLELLYATGLRVTEAITLSVENVHHDLGIVRCFGKGRKERIVPITKKALAAVSEYLEQERSRLLQQRSSDVLFLSRSGKPLGRETIRALVQKYARLGGIQRDVSPHTLRHSLATHLIQAGADLRVVQEILGHVRVETTEIYTHLDRADLKKAHAKFHPRG